MKPLEKDRNRRYESASAFAADVQRYLNDEPVLACPPSIGYRLGKYARKNRSTVAISAMAVMLLVAIAISGFFVAGQTRRQAERERDLVQRRIESNRKLNEALAALLTRTVEPSKPGSTTSEPGLRPGKPASAPRRSVKMNWPMPKQSKRYMPHWLRWIKQNGTEIYSLPYRRSAERWGGLPPTDPARLSRSRELRIRATERCSPNMAWI